LKNGGVEKISKETFLVRLAEKLSQHGTRAPDDLVHLEMKVEELVLDQSLKQ